MMVRRALSLFVVTSVALLSIGAAGPALAHSKGWPVERRGDASNNTWAIQYLLRSRGYALSVDGAYGRQTADRVRRFQKARGLTVDGIVGPETWPRLVRSAKRGGRGDHVRAVQSRLNANGYGLCIDGVFGLRTERAVRDFQRYHRLTVDGVVGHRTWHKLALRLLEEEFPAGPRPC